MIVYCTACCKKKREDLKKINSIDRYISGRIKKVYEKSRIDGVYFRIFSGKHGLLKPDEKIFWYDEKLSSQKVSAMVQKLKTQIIHQKISSIVFYAYNPQRNIGWKPYFDAMENACIFAKIEWKVRFL